MAAEQERKVLAQITDWLGKAAPCVKTMPSYVARLAIFFARARHLYRLNASAREHSHEANQSESL